MLLLLSLCGLWIWTAHCYRVVRFSRLVPGNETRYIETLDFAANRGLVQVATMRVPQLGPGFADGRWRAMVESSPNAGDLFIADRKFGFAGYDRTWMVMPPPQSLTRRTTAYVAPILFFVALTSVVPALRLVAFLRARRRARWGRDGRCESCGYDLRGSPGRCPECGAPPAAPAKPSAA